MNSGQQMITTTKINKNRFCEVDENIKKDYVILEKIGIPLL